jgi:hypothetical protein
MTNHLWWPAGIPKMFVGVISNRIALLGYTIEIYLLTGTHLSCGVFFRNGNYVCERKYRLTEGGGKATMVHPGVHIHALHYKV